MLADDLQVFEGRERGHLEMIIVDIILVVPIIVGEGMLVDVYSSRRALSCVPDLLALGVEVIAQCMLDKPLLVSVGGGRVLEHANRRHGGLMVLPLACGVHTWRLVPHRIGRGLQFCKARGHQRCALLRAWLAPDGPRGRAVPQQDKRPPYHRPEGVPEGVQEAAGCVGEAAGVVWAGTGTSLRCRSTQVC
jgi:hypothetical protein